MSAAKQIPSGFDTYTLFINPSVQYADKAVDKKVEILNKYFKKFGDSIGDKNLAVWVNEPNSDRLSISRGKYYADIFSTWANKSLEYSEGPYVIITDTHPDILSTAKVDKPPIVIAISFNGISEDRIIETLTFMEARIRRKELSTSNIRSNLHVLWVEMKSWADDKEAKQFLKDVIFKLIEKA